VSLVADFSLPRSELLLGDVPSDWTGRVQFERFVPATPDPFPFVRVRGDREAFAASARADPAVASLTERDVTSSWTRYRLVWTPDARRSIRHLFGDPVVLEAVAVRDWSFSVRFPEFAHVAVFRETAETSGFPLELHRLREESRTEDATTDLTDLQRETLALAIRRGYFEVPRSVTLSDLAAELGVSKQAVSERLRRALALLARDALGESPSR
jgi:hypothetical protein